MGKSGIFKTIFRKIKGRIVPIEIGPKAIKGARKTKSRAKLLRNWSPRYKKGKIQTLLKEAQNERKQYTTLQYGGKRFKIFGTGFTIKGSSSGNIKKKAVDILKRHRKLTTKAQRRKIFKDLKKLK